MIVIMNVGNRHPVRILVRRMEHDAVVFLRHILANDPHPSHIPIAIHLVSKVLAPAAGIKKGSHKGEAQSQGLQFVAAGKATGGVVPRNIFTG